MAVSKNLLGFFAIIVVCYGQSEEPKNCCFNEKQYEVFFVGNVGVVQEGTPIAISENIHTAVDVTGQRIGTEGIFYYYKGATISTKTIQLFKEGKQYTIVNKTCIVQPLTKGSELKKCLPDDAKFSQFISLGKHELLTQSWKINGSAQGMLGDTYVSVSDKTCAPLGESFNGIIDAGGKQVPTTSSGGFFNISSGIKDPKKWFNVPSSCPQNVTELELGSKNVDFQNSMMDFLAKMSSRIPLFLSTA